VGLYEGLGFRSFGEIAEYKAVSGRGPGEGTTSHDP
jgi:hypothetical protein